MQTIEHTGLDIAAVNPKNGTKFSPNLYKWLTKRGEKPRRHTSKIYREKDGALFIGMLDDGFLHGSQLMRVLCIGGKAEVFAYYLGQPEEIADFWERYAAVGRCAIDQAHAMHFTGDESRWQTEGDTRECLWCGNHSQTLRRWIDPVERQRWETVPSNAQAVGRNACGASHTSDGLGGS